MATFPASPAPSQTSAGAIKTRVNEVKFGDGYAARSPEGLNSVVKVYNLFWKTITETERTNFDDFLKDKKGATPFQWTPPNGSQLNWVCRDWNWVHTEGIHCDFRAVFEQDFAV